MAFGFSPKYIQTLSLDGLTNEQFIVLATGAAKALNWNVGTITETGFVAYTPFSMSSWSEEVDIKLEDGEATIKSECTGTQMVDWGKNKRNVEAFLSEFEGLKNASTPDELAAQYEEIKSTIALDGNGISGTHTATKSKITSFFSIFRPVEGFFVTPIIIDINIAVFILMVISGVDFMSPTTANLLAWGANFRPMTLGGQEWRLLTNVFLHIGIFHLLFNMYALLYIGLLLEPHLGKIRFAAAYLLTGIAASTASLYWHDMTVSAGASGAIFGMYGVFLAMLTTNFIEKSARRALLTSIVVFVGYNLVNGLKEGIDNAAHVGGLVSGLVIGYAYYPSLKNPEKMDLQWRTIAALSVMILFLCFLTCRSTTNVIGEYDTKMNGFADMEKKALKVFSMPKNTSHDSLLSEIKNRGIYYWNQNIALLNNVEKMNLPTQIHDRDKTLLRYCNLRIKSYNLIYKMVAENTDKYKDSITMYNGEIKGIIDSLGAK
jgi:rhomboid protease GluP